MSTWRSVLVSLCAWLGASPLAAQAAPARQHAWSERTLELAASLPVQDGGRIKPLSTFASFTLLRINGQRSTIGPSGTRLEPTAWLLDVVFFPEDAARAPCFLVQNAEVLDALGVHIDGKHKRDRYTYQELEPGLAKLFALAHEYDRIPAAERGVVQEQTVFLAESVQAFLSLNRHDTLALVPPSVPVAQREEWSTFAELARAAPQSLAQPHARAMTLFDTLVEARADAPRFESALAELHTELVGLAAARGEYEHIELELGYYRANPLRWSLMLFVAGFLAAAVSWLAPRARVPYALAWGTALVATLGLCAAITVRCMIRERPPVTTLYETVLFVTAVGALVALAMEAINRQRIALSACVVLGMLGLFIAHGYETLDKRDTMPSLVAVLDTNFWLATHVTAITVGYSAGMLAALLASGYLLLKLIRPSRADTLKNLAGMTYGVVCFGVIFTTVGTILGGIWANESWGRFWGWDPKENGALLIVISQIAMLHGRMCGWLKEHGLCMAAAFAGTIVAFSWWGVNLLGVGLHSYGFTSGIHGALWSYYGLQWGIVALGALAALRAKRAAKKLPAPIFTPEAPAADSQAKAA